MPFAIRHRDDPAPVLAPLEGLTAAREGASRVGLGGRGIYPRLLQHIVRLEGAEAERFWIIHAPENRASGSGIRKAGFTTSGEISFDAHNSPAVDVTVGDEPDATGLLGVPRARGPLAPCWRCARAGRPWIMFCAPGGCTCDYQVPDRACENGLPGSGSVVWREGRGAVRRHCKEDVMIFDVVVVGGGVAGLNAALVLGRSSRRTLVLDGGPPRNSASPAAHGFLTRDGTPPLELLRLGLKQLRPYGTVEVETVAATDIRAGDDGFEVTLDTGVKFKARRVLLATGVSDELPPIPGLAALWGTGVLHCPFCHGWEVRDRPLAVYGRGAAAFEFTRLLLGWSRDLVLCSDGPAELDSDQRSRLERWGVGVREERVVRLEGGGELERIVFAGGAPIRRRALFIQPPQRPGSDLGTRLGCESLPGGALRVESDGQTTVQGVYAAGDAAATPQQLVMAAASGARAAIAIQKDLIAADFA